MSSFLARNKAPVSQICEGDTYPTIGAVLTAIRMCISSMRPTTACSVVKDASTVTATNSSLTPTASRVSGEYTRHLHVLSRATSKILSFLVLRSLCMTSDCCRLLCRIVSPPQTVPSISKEQGCTTIDYSTLSAKGDTLGDSSNISNR